MVPASPRYSIFERNNRYLQTLFITEKYSKYGKEKQGLMELLDSNQDFSQQNSTPKTFVDIYRENLYAPIRNCKGYSNFLSERLDLSFDKCWNSFLKIVVGVVSIGAGCYFMVPSSKPENPISYQGDLKTDRIR
ncbi:MAG: hypothetical protein ACO26G_01555 [Rickettsiales bacterium]|jgi:hypothetical protein